ncbi:MAG: aminotransferase class V-fold PLP-dependent enzyme [Vicinamibacterales bacterium]
MSAPLASRADFLSLDGVVHLAGGGQTPALARHRDALTRALAAKGTGLAGAQANDQVRQRVAAKVAALIGADPDDIGFPSSVAHGVSLVADAVDWRDGDNVVMERWEFPSLMNPFLAARRHGVEIRAVAPEPSTWRAPLARFAEAVDRRTRVVAVSHVSFLTGERHDLEAYAALARKAGALFVVDASHALGSVRVEATVADLLVGCCYKFLLGQQGVAVAYWNRARVPDWRPALTGWHSVSWRPPMDVPGDVAPFTTGRAFEPGNLAWGPLYVLDAALDYLAALGMDAVEAHTLALSGDLRARLVAHGLPVLTPEPSAARAGSVAVAASAPERIREALEAAGVLVTGEHGRVRASVHVYNDGAEVAAGADALASAARMR